jgi:hypothetical protein
MSFVGRFRHRRLKNCKLGFVLCQKKHGTMLPTIVFVGRNVISSWQDGPRHLNNSDFGWLWFVHEVKWLADDGAAPPSYEASEGVFGAWWVCWQNVKALSSASAYAYCFRFGQKRRETCISICNAPKANKVLVTTTFIKEVPNCSPSERALCEIR